MLYTYDVYSLKIQSEIEFPEFLSNNNDSPPDVFIKLGITPKTLGNENVITKVRYQASPNKVLYTLKGVGSIFIENGKDIIVELEENTDLEYIKNLIRSRAIAAIIQQRKWTVLHGSAFHYNGKAILFLGQSGAGKSTTLGGFIEQGFDFISDDLCLIKKKENEKNYYLYPAFPNIRLWSHAIDLIKSDENLQKGNPVRTDIDKYFMLPKTGFVNRPIPVSHIYILSSHQSANIEIRDLNNSEKLSLLMNYVFAKAHLEGLGGYEEQFETLSYLLERVSIKSIARPIYMETENFWHFINVIKEDFTTK